MHRLAQVREERKQVKNARDNGKKRKFMEGVNRIEGVWNDRRFVYENKSGMTDKLFDKETGEEVKKDRILQPNKKIFLSANFDLTPVKIDRAETPEDVANLAARFEVLGEVEKELNNSIREIELGLIEDWMIGQNIDDLDIKSEPLQYGGITYKITVLDDNTYDYPEGTAELWKADKLEMKSVETRSQWRASEVGKEEKEANELELAEA